MIGETERHLSALQEAHKKAAEELKTLSELARREREEKMSDIVDVLRKAAGVGMPFLTDPEWQRGSLFWRSADEIERLRAELEAERERRWEGNRLALAEKDEEVSALRAECDTLQKRVMLAEGAAEMLDRMDDEGQAEITRLRAELEAERERWRLPEDILSRVHDMYQLSWHLTQEYKLAADILAAVEGDRDE